MKNIAILILFLLFSTQSTTLLAQVNTQKIGSPNVTSIIQGGLQADSAFRAPFLPKNYNYTKGQTTFRQLILATEDSSLYINRGDVQTKIFTQRDTNTAYGPTTPFYVNQQINTLINDSALEVKSLGFGIKRIDTILYVDTPSVVTQTVIKTKYVPYDSAKANVNLGEFDITTSNVHTDTVMARGSLGLHLHGTGGKGIMVGAGGGGNITFDDYPTSVTGDSVLSTNSSGGLVRYNLKDKLADYLLKADTSILFDSINLKLNIVDTSNIRLRPIAGDNMAITGTYPNLTFSATGGGSAISASTSQVLYKSSGDTAISGADKVGIDTTDGRIVFPFDTSGATPYVAGTKMFGSTRMGMSSIRVIDTTSIPSSLQRALNMQSVSQMYPVSAITYTNKFSVASTIFPPATSTNVFPAYNSTIQHLNYGKIVYTTAAGANSSAQIRFASLISSYGIICGNTRYSGGGGRGTFVFCLPTYDPVERIFMGYSVLTSNVSTDPSFFMASQSCLGVGKDAGDSTLHFFHSTNTVVVPTTKVDIGIVPNAEDVYRVVVYVSPNSEYYIQLDVMSKSAPIATYILHPTSNVPVVGTKLVMCQYINKGSAAGVVSFGLIQSTEEIY
jgi:hypothetical protein